MSKLSSYIAFFLSITFMVSCQSIVESERELFLKLNSYKPSYYREFNLTSKETEIHHFDERLKLLQSMKLSSGTKSKEAREKITEGFRVERKDFVDFWDEFYSSVSTDASLYFVSFKKNEHGLVSDVTGYYLIKNGVLIKESLTEW